MRHAIIGAGNLGWDLLSELKRRGIEAAILSRSNGFHVEDSVALMKVLTRPGFDVIWYCVGGGSIAEAISNPVESRRMLVSLPMLVAKSASPDKRLVFFSSDYAADETDPRNSAKTGGAGTNYAALKIELENKLLAMARPNTAIVRVGSLFGTRKPAATFPGKILTNFGFNDATISLPENLVTPTPTMWLAAKLVENFDKLFHVQQTQRHHCAPRGSVSVKDWATFILQGLRGTEGYSHKASIDRSRPRLSNLGCCFAKAEHWEAVWQHYFRRVDYVPREFLALYLAKLPTSRIRMLAEVDGQEDFR